jgi:hypothetical protein
MAAAALAGDARANSNAGTATPRLQMEHHLRLLKPYLAVGTSLELRLWVRAIKAINACQVSTVRESLT